MGKVGLYSSFIIASAIMMSCVETKPELAKDLVVVEHTDSVCGDNEGNHYEQVTFAVDVPVDGPQALVDSVLVFINRELYDACENYAHCDEKVVAFSKEEMFTDDGEQLLSHYMSKYKTILQDSLCGVFGFTLKMEAQTIVQPITTIISFTGCQFWMLCPKSRYGRKPMVFGVAYL